MRKSLDNVNRSGEVPAEDVFEAIHQLMHRYRAGALKAVSAPGGELTHMELKTLGYFARHPGSTLSELAAHSGRDKSQLARLIAALRERGLLEAQPDENDRRNLRLRCTAEAVAVHQATRRQFRRLAEESLAGLTAGERAELARLVGKASANLAQAGDS